jgi:hypothetical protein
MATGNPWDVVSVSPSATPAPSAATKPADPWAVVSVSPTPGTPITDNSTISAAPKTTAASVLHNVSQIPVDPVGSVAHALDSVTSEIENYTQQGREEHPILSRIGDVTRHAKEMLTGGQSAGESMGTSSGVLNNPVTTAISAAPGVAEVGALAQSKLADAVEGVKAARAAKAATEASKVLETGEVSAGHLTKAPEPELPNLPKPNHGSPLTIDSPLDSGAFKGAGAKDLSPEALNEIQSRQGAVIPKGSTLKNILMKDVEPNSRLISDKVAEMNKLVQDAPATKTTVAEDNTLQPEIDALKTKRIPKSEREKLGENVDEEIKNASDALNSNKVDEILAYRRQLGNEIDWDKTAKNPETAGEVQNEARKTIYRALGNKVHTEVPATVPIDKTLQPNLELRSYYRNNLGDRAVDSPADATIEHQNEFQKGRAQVQTDEKYAKAKAAVDAHNAKVDRNWSVVRNTLIALGAGDAIKHAMPFLP